MSSFLWVRCPEAATWQPVKEMAKRHPHKWDMEADGTLIAVLFTAVEVLPRCCIEVRDTLRSKQTPPEEIMWSIFVPRWKHFGGDFFPLQAAHVRTLGDFRKDIGEWERSTGRNAIPQKGLRRPLTFLYARTESPDMVLAERRWPFGIVPSGKCRAASSAWDCARSQNSRERQVKYTRSNQPFTERPMRNTFSSRRWSHTGGIRLRNNLRCSMCHGRHNGAGSTPS